MYDSSIIEFTYEKVGDGIFKITPRQTLKNGEYAFYLLGTGEGHSHEHISQAISLTTSAAKEAGERAYAMAGIGPRDIDVAELYDCFTPVVIIELEDLGFCPKGEGGRFVEGGRIELGGELPPLPSCDIVDLVS